MVNRGEGPDDRRGLAFGGENLRTPSDRGAESETQRERGGPVESGAEEEKQSRSQRLWRGLTGPGGLRIAFRIVVFLVGVGIVYAGFQRLTYWFFGPHLEVVRSVVPEGSAQAGAPVTLGVLVRNAGRSTGASFVVAALGDGVEVEGPTVEIAARDSAMVPVRVSLAPGITTLALVVFDGWRGVRQITKLEGITASAQSRTIDVSDIGLPSTLVRGQVVALAIPWRNSGLLTEKLTPMMTFRPASGEPIVVSGEEVTVPAGQSTTLSFPLDTWNLRAGSYSADLLLQSSDGDVVGRGGEPFTVEITEP